MISFDNTEVAFKHKTNSQLKKAYWLFKMVGSPWLVKFGKSFTVLAFNLRLPIKGLVKKTIFEQFCGGETIEECNHTIALLKKHNIGTILDYSVEGKEDESDFENTCNEIIATISKAKNNPSIPFSVFKVTGIAQFSILEKANDGFDKLNTTEQQKMREITERVERICSAAYDAKVPVFIDAEESWIQNTIDALAEQMMEKFNKERAIVFNTIQLYRWDRLAFLKQSHQKAKDGNYFLGLKLVRGAYMEKERTRAEEKGYPSPIQKTKEDSDKDYNLALDYCIENIDTISICAGTHNEKSSQYLAELLTKKQLYKNNQHVYFAQLLGMSDHISFNLSNEGYNVAKYVPYGPVKEVLPYLIRRAEENTSVAGQTSRELSLIIKEKNRRSH
jgi:proline dehydrogenase